MLSLVCVAKFERVLVCKADVLIIAAAELGPRGTDRETRDTVAGVIGLAIWVDGVAETTSTSQR